MNHGDMQTFSRKPSANNFITQNPRTIEACEMEIDTETQLISPTGEALRSVDAGHSLTKPPYH